MRDRIDGVLGLEPWIFFRQWVRIIICMRMCHHGVASRSPYIRTTWVAASTLSMVLLSPVAGIQNNPGLIPRPTIILDP